MYLVAKLDTVQPPNDYDGLDYGDKGVQTLNTPDKSIQIINTKANTDSVPKTISKEQHTYHQAVLDRIM